MANPFITGSTPVQQNNINNLPVFQEYAWDFDSDNFIFENALHKVVTENEALKVWIYKTLKTERWRYRAYESSYGIELEQFFGKYTNNGASAQLIKQYVSEALLVNPYIKKINNITHINIDDKLTLNVELTTIYGDLAFSVKI